MVCGGWLRATNAGRSIGVETLRALLEIAARRRATLSAVIALQDLRRRPPFLVFVVLAIVCLVLLGFACVCATDHPSQTIARALSAIPAAPPLVEV